MSGPSFSYSAYGLLIRSFRELPLPPFDGADPDRDPDLVVERGTVGERSDAPLDRDDPAIVAGLDGPEGRWYVAVATDDGYRLTFRDCGEFILRDDWSSIRWIEDGSRSELLPVLFAGTVLALYLTMRRQHLVLHASAVARRGRAVAFVGQSGRGKSTLAALGAAAGARVVTDDVLLVDVGERPICRGSGGELRLRDGASTIAPTVASAQVGTTADQRLGLLPANVEAGWVDLGAIVIPSPSHTATEVTVTPIPSSRALFMILAFPRVHGLRSPEVLRTQFEMLGELVRTVPVYDVVVPWGPPFSPTIADALLELAGPVGD